MDLHADFPVPLLLVSSDQKILSTGALRASLGVNELSDVTLSKTFEVYSADGAPLSASALPWKRAARGEEFQDRQIWWDRRSGASHYLSITACRQGDESLLVLQDGAESWVASRFAKQVGRIAAVFEAEDASVINHTIVIQVSHLLSVDAVGLFQGQDPACLEVVDSVGWPRLSTKAPELVVHAALTRTLQHRAELYPAPEADRVLFTSLQERGMRSLTAAPLIDAGQLLGVLALARRTPGKLATLESHLLDGVCTICAGALRQMELWISNGLISRRLRTVTELTAKTPSGLPLGALLYELSKQACHLVGASQGTITLLHDMERGIYASAREHACLQLVTDRSRKPVLRVPLRIADELVGELCVEDPPSGKFASEDKELLELFSAQAVWMVGYAKQSRSLDEQHRLLDAILQQAPDGILFFDASQGDLVFSNPAAQRIFGRSLDSAPRGDYARAFGIKHPDGDYFAPSELPSTRALRGEVVQRVELEIERPDGGVSYVAADAAPVEADGQVRGAVVVLQDISSFKEMERLREELAAVIAHDLRNPLQSIILHLQTLMRKADGPSVQVPRDTLHILMHRGLRLSQMINDLLDASRIELRRLSLDPRTLPVDEMIVEFVEQIRPTLGDHEVRVSCEDNLEVWADPLRLEEIVTNLLENAAKYSDVAQPIDLTIRSERDGVQLSVSDHGAGIAPEDFPRLFDRFYQAKRARQKRSGVGLGLYITKGLVEAHGGQIWVESVPGQGSTFHVWLPRKPEMEAHGWEGR